jgi:hypothetical protein
MLVALAWMLLAGLPLANPSPPTPILHRVRPALSAERRIAVWTDRDDPYRRGEGARVYLELDQPAHVTVLRVDTDGRLRVLFPREPWSDTFIREERRTIEIPGSRGGRSFIIDDYPGVGYLLAVASPEAFDYRDIARGDYWDYRLIGGGRIQGDPYVVLTDLAERIAPGGHYDYDIVPYYVDRHYDYPRFVCYDCHAYASFDRWDPYRRSCTRFRVVIYDDPRYYPYRYGRGVVVQRPLHPGPRYVFRDAEPGADYVTRVPAGGRADDRVRRRPEDRGRTSEDVGGRGTVPAPGVGPVVKPPPEGRRPGEAQAQPLRAEPRRREPPAPAVQPKPAEPPAPETRRRADPSDRRNQPPRSTGEPELRRRKP